MKAAVFHGPGGSWPKRPMAVEEVPAPRPGPGELLVRVAACGVCATDLEYLKVPGTTPKPPPLILGHEPSGVVAEVGDGVERFAPGDRVLVATAAPCLACARCLAGGENLCPNMALVGANRDGAFAEYVAAPASGVFPLPDSLPLEESAIITDAVATAYRAVYSRAEVKAGETVAIFGASGGLGLIAVQLAAGLGAHVIAIGRKRWKLDKARALGAEAALSTEETDSVDRAVKKLLGGGADVCIDASGRAGMIACACRTVRPGGRVVVPGFSFEKMELAVNRLMWQELNLLGSKNYRPSELAASIALVAEKKLDIAQVVSHRFPLDRINEAYLTLEKGEMLRGIVIP